MKNIVRAIQILSIVSTSVLISWEDHPDVVDTSNLSDYQDIPSRDDFRQEDGSDSPEGTISDNNQGTCTYTPDNGR